MLLTVSAAPHEPPAAKRDPVPSELHGLRRSDPYAWLKDENWQEVMKRPEVLNAEIRNYLEAENAYLESVLAPLAPLRQTLFEEMQARIKQDDSTVPQNDGDWAYYRRFETGGQHPIFCRTPRGGGGDEEILLHGDREAKGHAFFRIARCRHSPDHRLLAYAVDIRGSEYYDIALKDLLSGQILPDRPRNTQGDFVWGNDSTTLFYTILDEKHRPSKVFRHRVGSDVSEDELVYEEPDPGFFVGLSKTESKRFVLISAHDHTTSEVRVIPADRPESPPRIIAPREQDLEYDLSDAGDRFLVRTNADGAIDFKIVEATLDTADRAEWRDVVPHREGCLLLELHVFAGHMVRLERENGLPRIVITHLESGDSHNIAFDESAYDLDVIPGYLYDTSELRFSYSSMTTPLQVFDYDMARRTRKLRKTQEVPSGHDPDAYVTERIFATAHDGTEVPISLLYRKQTLRGSDTPLLLYGYGAYGISIPASFSTNRLSLVDRGFVYAIAHIRGGMEKGYRWYLDGKLQNKTNTFSDFITSAEKLIETGYTGKGRIVAQGGSAGGMLMGAVANIRPDLFKAILAEVPFVDVLATMCDADLPLTPPEWPEWGNPLEDRDAYERIAAYSPYDNVVAKDYPNILVTAGLTDPRVTYWEPAKWVAKLRALKTDDNLLLLRTNMTAGHAGAAGRFDKLKEVALNYAFALMLSGRA